MKRVFIALKSYFAKIKKRRIINRLFLSIRQARKKRVVVKKETIMLVKVHKNIINNKKRIKKINKLDKPKRQVLKRNCTQRLPDNPQLRDLPERKNVTKLSPVNTPSRHSNQSPNKPTPREQTINISNIENSLAHSSSRPQAYRFYHNRSPAIDIVPAAVVDLNKIERADTRKPPTPPQPVIQPNPPKPITEEPEPPRQKERPFSHDHEELESKLVEFSKKNRKLNVELTSKNPNAEKIKNLENKIAAIGKTIRAIMKEKYLDINQQDFNGRTILHLAAQYDCYRLTRDCNSYAKRSGRNIDYNIKDNNGKRAIDIIFDKNNEYFPTFKVQVGLGCLAIEKKDVNIEKIIDLYPDLGKLRDDYCSGIIDKKILRNTIDKALVNHELFLKHTRYTQIFQNP